MISMLDIGIILGYLLLMLFIGYLSGKDNKNQDDYFVASRSMPWLPVALSVAATMISANSFIGGPGWAYHDGMFPVMINIAVPLAVFFALYITTPIIYSLKVTSVYQYMGLRFGSLTRALTIFQFFVNSMIQASSMAFVPILIIHRITGWPLSVLIPVIVIITIIYTMMGGIKAVIWTDAIQMFVVIGAVIFVIITICTNTNTDLYHLAMQAKAAGKLSTLKFNLDISDNETFWVTLFGGTFMWIRYFCFDQTQVQRVLTSKTLEQAKKSFVISSFIMNIVYFLMLFIGALLFCFYKGRPFETQNDVMITFILHEIPKGEIGLIIAGVFAAAMSSIDSLLNSMSAVFSKDVYEFYFKKGEASLKVSMIFTAAIGAVMVAVILIGFNSNARSVLDLVGNYISFFAGPALGVFLLGMFTRRANDRGAAVGFLTGLVGNVLIAGIFHTGWLWNPVTGALITCTIGYGASCVLKDSRPVSETEQYTAFAIRKAEQESGLKTGPFSFGKYEAAVLIFFVLQYLFLSVLQY